MNFTKKEESLISYIRNTRFLQEHTKQIYINRLFKIKTNIYNKNIDYIILHPKMFAKKLEHFSIHSNEGRLNTSIGDHAKDGYISAIKALFIYNQTLKEKYKDIYDAWECEHQKIRKPIDDKYKSNAPTDRQKKGYISFQDVLSTRNQLEDGSVERLLLTIYTDIPPVRSDFYNTQLFFINHSDEFQSIKSKMDPHSNFIIIPHNDKTQSVLILRKYKTCKHYKELDIPLTLEIVKQIELSLIKQPRSFLFVGKNNKPFIKENSFNVFANRLIKKIFQNPNISLCMFRHIYISRQDLQLATKSGLEQDKIAHKMGHSINQQARYRWLDM